MTAYQRMMAFRNVFWLGLTLVMIFQATQSHALGSNPTFSKVGAIRSGQSIQYHTQQAFEALLGQRLENSDLQLIQDVTEQAENYAERPQNVGLFGSEVEARFMVCIQAKVAGPKIFVGLGGEIMPCVEVPSGRSYVMYGFSGGSIGHASASLTGAIYFGSEQLETPVIGEYLFFNWTQQVHPLINVQLQLSFSSKCVGEKGEEWLLEAISKVGWKLASQGCQIIGMGGVGVDMLGVAKQTFKRLQKAYKTLRNGAMKTDQAIPYMKGAAEKRIGVTFKIVEFPWWDRMYNQGIYDPREIFAGLGEATTKK